MTEQEKKALENCPFFDEKFEQELHELQESLASMKGELTVIKARISYLQILESMSIEEKRAWFGR